MTNRVVIAATLGTALVAGCSSEGGSGDGASGAGGANALTAGSGGSGACTKDLAPAPGQDDCTAPLKPNDDRLCKLTYDGQPRQFYIYASPSFDPCQPASLVMDLHGLSESAEVHTGKEGFNLTGQQYPKGYGSGWRMAVQRDNAIVVTPQGVSNAWTVGSDVGFLNQAADTVEAIAGVDPEKVYVTGISMGGQMTVATGCADATRWRGMAPVAMLTQSCAKLDRAMPVISFHSSTDSLTSYAADRSGVENIAALSHCKAGPTESLQYGGPATLPDPVCYVTPNGVGAPDAADALHVPLQPCQSSAPVSTCVTWSQCDESVEVVFCTVAGATQPLGGHILYNNDTQLDLPEVAWPFFKKFWK